MKKGLDIAPTNRLYQLQLRLKRMKNAMYNITNAEDGTEACVWLNSDGKRFNVVLRDTDADQMIRTIIVTDYAKATAIADSVAALA